MVYSKLVSSSETSKGEFGSCLWVGLRRKETRGNVGIRREILLGEKRKEKGRDSGGICLDV